MNSSLRKEHGREQTTVGRERGSENKFLVKRTGHLIIKRKQIMKVNRLNRKVNMGLNEQQGKRINQ